MTCTGSCKNAVNDTHLSKPAGGAVFKTVLKCTGYGLDSVNVRTRGALTFAPSKSATNTKVSFRERGTSDLSQKITVNGKAVTYYTPGVGKNGGRGTGFWRATATWQFMVGDKYSTVGSQTRTLWKTV